MASEIGRRLKSIKIFGRRRRHSEASLASSISHNGTVQLINNFNYSTSPLVLESEETDVTLLNRDRSCDDANGGDKGECEMSGKSCEKLVREEELYSTRSSHDVDGSGDGGDGDGDGDGGRSRSASERSIGSGSDSDRNSSSSNSNIIAATTTATTATTATTTATTIATTTVAAPAAPAAAAKDLEAVLETEAQTNEGRTPTAAVAETPGVLAGVEQLTQEEIQGPRQAQQQPTARQQGSTSTWNQRRQQTGAAKPLGLTNDLSGKDLQQPSSLSLPLSPPLPLSPAAATATPAASPLSPTIHQATTPPVLIVSRPGLCSIDEQPPSPSTASTTSCLSSSSSTNSHSHSHADARDLDNHLDNHLDSNDNNDSDNNDNATAAHDSSQRGNGSHQLSPAVASLSTPTQTPNRRPVSPTSAPAPVPSSPSLRSAVQTPASASSPTSRPKAISRRQSIISTRHTSFIESLLSSSDNNNNNHVGPRDINFGGPIATAASMSTFSHSDSDAKMPTPATSMRKVWVRKQNHSPTLITINHHDLVDDVRDAILKKYANSLGRTFDSPDLTIRIFPRDDKPRTLGPEEPMGDTIDAYFPEGQDITEALVIDIPRRTPKASPRAPHPSSTTTTAAAAAAAAAYYNEDGRPPENGEGYFPPVTGVPSPHLPTNLASTTNGVIPHSMSVIGSGHLPPIPSPGGRSRQYRERQDRPRLGRTHTSSPNLHNGIPVSMPASTISGHGTQHHRPRHSHSRTHSSSSDIAGIHTAGTPMTKSPGQEMAPARINTTSPRVTSPRMGSARPKKSKKTGDYSGSQQGMLNSAVPPISVLIVEDNPINLKLLEAFVKRLKVRWQTAMNGRDAVRKWRSGGFHLVLMDIQLPVMNGLDATREIRRLERLNNIGVFSSTAPNSLPDAAAAAVAEELTEADRLQDPAQFKSPVIIVALTASSLQSDRHEALAAGCNDFLTKPVNFVWLERKVMEWGCMQALIDFDGWRKWKDFSERAEEMEANKRAQAQSSKSKSKKNRSSLLLS